MFTHSRYNYILHRLVRCKHVIPHNRQELIFWLILKFKHQKIHLPPNTVTIDSYYPIYHHPLLPQHLCVAAGWLLFSYINHLHTYRITKMVSTLLCLDLQEQEHSRHEHTINKTRKRKKDTTVSEAYLSGH